MPETPLYLLSKGKSSEAQKSLMWLRGADSHEDIAEELICIEASLENSINSDSATLKDLMKPSVLKPAFICLMLMLFQQFGGINGVTFYSVDIFKDAGTNINDNLSAIILGIVQVVFGFVSTVCVERLGRRILLTVSELGLTVSLFALGTYFYIKAENPESAANLGWLPLTSLIVYVMSFNFGVGPVPWTLMGELPPAHAKGFVSSLTTAFSWGLGFIITKFFKDMITTLTAYGCYWLFGAISFAGLVYCIMFVPETKGKSALEIQRNFEKR
jgi:facilitated trehalose transporter